MSIGRGENEGVRILHDFDCQAIPGSGLASEGPCGRGRNAGVHVLAEFDVSDARVALAEERQAELRQLETAALRALVRSNGSGLLPEELRFIHDLAIGRLTQNGTSVPGAAELSREVMHVAVTRIA